MLEIMRCPLILTLFCMSMVSGHAGKTIGPENTFAVLGQSTGVILFCKSPRTHASAFSWKFTPSGSHAQHTIVKSCVASKSYSNYVGLDLAFDNESCSLFIKSVDESVAGQYTCVVNGQSYSAQFSLIVCNTNINPASPNISAGTKVDMTCNCSFIGADNLEPSIAWSRFTISPDSMIVQTLQHNATFVSSMLVTIYNTAGSVYYCTANLSPSKTHSKDKRVTHVGPNMATNKATYQVSYFYLPSLAVASNVWPVEGYGSMGTGGMEGTGSTGNTGDTGSTGSTGSTDNTGDTGSTDSTGNTSSIGEGPSNFFTQSPFNMISSGQVTILLPCTTSSSPSSSFFWFFTPVGSAVTHTVVESCSALKPHYKTNLTSANSCNLEFKVTEKTAGVYTCSVDGHNASAEVDYMVCQLSSNITTPELPVGSYASMTFCCHIKSVGVIKPHFSWQFHEFQGSLTSVVGSTQTDTYASSTLTDLVGFETDTFYGSVYCDWSSNGTALPGSASNNPCDNWGTLNLETRLNTQVIGAPQDMSAFYTDSPPDNPSGTCYGSWISCYGNANPDYAVEWLFPNGSYIHEDPVKVYMCGSNLTFICYASNILGSANVTLVLNITSCDLIDECSNQTGPVADRFKIKPSNTMAMVGQLGPSVMNCATYITNISSFNWFLTPNGTTTLKEVLNGCQSTSNQYKGLGFLQSTCNIEFDNIVPSMAGLYTCEVDGMNASAELTLLNNCQTNSNISSDAQVSAGTYMWMSCSCQFFGSGKVQPDIIWSSNSSIVAVANFSNSTYAESTLLIVAEPGLPSSYTCTAAFSAILHAPAVNQATNLPTYDVGSFQLPSQVINPTNHP